MIKNKYIEVIKEVVATCERENKSAQKTKEYMDAICTKCLMPYNPDCDICNGHTTIKSEITNQLSLVFDDL